MTAQANDQGPFAPPPSFPAEQAHDGVTDVHVAQAAATAELSVDLRSRQEALGFFKAVYLASENTPMNWTGSHSGCNPGQTSEFFRESILRRINFFRAMAGVPAEVELSDEYNAAAQEAALMMSAQRDLSHDPDTNWTCYTVAGADAAGHSNLYLSSYLSNPVDGYIKDPGPNNYFVGHRRWILHPPTQKMGTGDIPSVNGFPATNALWVLDEDSIFGQRPATRDDFVAWPPSGFVPYQVVYARWSFGYPEADFSAATVTMTRNGQPIDLRLDGEVRENYGENTLVWIPMGMADGDNWEQPADDTVFNVTINNVRVSGATRNFSYEVTVFDPGVEITAPGAPIITLPDPVGAPGSELTVLGSNYPAGEVLDIQINGVTLATATTGSAGKFAAVLNTEGVDTGVFKMSIEPRSAAVAAAAAAANTPNASTYFTLDATASVQTEKVPSDYPEPVKMDVSDALNRGILVFLPTIVRQ